MWSDMFDVNFLYFLYVCGTAMPLQAMQYASPKAIWNLLFGVNRPTFGKNEGNDIFHQIVSYGHFYLLFLCAFLFSLLYFFFYLFYFHVPSNMSLHKSGTVYFENHGSVDSMHPFSLSFNDLISITETRIKSHLLCNGYRGISNWKNPTICELYIWFGKQVIQMFSSLHLFFFQKTA